MRMPYRRSNLPRRRIRFLKGPKFHTHSLSEDSKIPPRRHTENNARIMENISCKDSLDSTLPLCDRTRVHLPASFSSFSPIQDTLETKTSATQRQTVELCLSYLKESLGSRISSESSNAYGVPNLERQNHVSFLHETIGDLPRSFVFADALRPWIIYWALTALYLLGEDVTQYRERVIATLAPFQNRDGGFGGGPNQTSHCASSYAAVLSLITVGGVAALNLIDRKALSTWIGNLKQADGGFCLSVGGEEDVRGAYCAMVMVSLLNLTLELPESSPGKVFPDATLLTGLPEYLSRCQTYEGGMSSSPDNEAHGAYTFCTLACLCLIGSPQDMLNRNLDVPLLISWLSARQYGPEGGFSGRTNKLVDGCYSHWVGGCWPLVDAAIAPPTKVDVGQAQIRSRLYSHEGIVRYIFCCCQDEDGGLRDKPEKHPDGYHTCYVLAGLSSNQHDYRYGGVLANDSASNDGAKIGDGPLTAAFGWVDVALHEDVVFSDDNQVERLHPVFALPWGAAERTRLHFESIS